MRRSSILLVAAALFVTVIGVAPAAAKQVHNGSNAECPEPPANNGTCLGYTLALTTPTHTPHLCPTGKHWVTRTQARVLGSIDGIAVELSSSNLSVWLEGVNGDWHYGESNGSAFLVVGNGWKTLVGQHFSPSAVVKSVNPKIVQVGFGWHSSVQTVQTRAVARCTAN